MWNQRITLAALAAIALTPILAPTDAQAGNITLRVNTSDGSSHTHTRYYTHHHNGPRQRVEGLVQSHSTISGGRSGASVRIQLGTPQHPASIYHNHGGRTRHHGRVYRNHGAYRNHRIYGDPSIYGDPGSYPRKVIIRKRGRNGVVRERVIRERVRERVFRSPVPFR